MFASWGRVSINALVHSCFFTAAAVTSSVVTPKVRFTDRSKAKKKHMILNSKKRICESVNRTVVFVRTIPPQGPLSGRSGAFD